MSSEQYREQGIAAAKAKRTDEARKLLAMAVKLNPNDATAWLYLASLTSDKKERLLCLQKVLLIDPTNDLALKAVQALGVDPKQLIALGQQKQPPAPPPTPPASAPTPTAVTAAEADDDIDINASPYDDIDINASPYDDIDADDSPDATFEASDADDSFDTYAQGDDAFADPFAGPFSAPDDDEAGLTDGGAVFLTDAPAPRSIPSAPLQKQTDILRPPPVDQSVQGVPIPDRTYLEQALLKAEQIVSLYAASPTPPIRWTQKTKNRAGELELTRYRAQLIGMGVGIVLMFLIVGGVFLATNPDAQRIVFNVRTPTNTPTPTFTPTNTPGLTATPSPTIDFTANPTFTPSPTFNPTFTPLGVLNVRTPRPTRPPLPNIEIGVERSFALINAGNYADAVATLEIELRAVSNNFNPNPYYASAIALMLKGESDRAFTVMDEAAERAASVSGADAPIFESVVDLGYAEIYLLRAQQAIESGKSGTADLEQAVKRADEALAFDPRIARAHVIKARAAALANDYESALQLLAEAREIEGLADNVSLVTEQAEILLQQGTQLLNDDTTRAQGISTLKQAEYAASEALYLNPYEERAHAVRTRAALAEGRAGQAVLYTETWRIAASRSPAAFRLLGDARIAEGNTELALDAYTRAVDLGADSASLVAALQARADLYIKQRRYDLALADMNRAVEADASPSVVARRMIAAYLAKDYATVIADADAISGTGTLPNGDIQLIKARAIIDSTAALGGTRQINDALQLLNSATVSKSQRGVWEEYRARAYFALGEYDSAAESIVAALREGISGARYYLRGQIEEARAIDLLAAIRSYEWVTAWDTVYAYPYAQDAAQRAQQLSTRVAVTATVAALTATAAAEIPTTGTPEGTASGLGETSTP